MTKLSNTNFPSTWMGSEVRIVRLAVSETPAKLLVWRGWVCHIPNLPALERTPGVRLTVSNVLSASCVESPHQLSTLKEQEKAMFILPFRGGGGGFNEASGFSGGAKLGPSAAGCLHL